MFPKDVPKFLPTNLPKNPMTLQGNQTELILQAEGEISSLEVTEIRDLPRKERVPDIVKPTHFIPDLKVWKEEERRSYQKDLGTRKAATNDPGPEALEERRT